MWALVLDTPQRFSVVDTPNPTAADMEPGDVLLRTLAGGICGSDLPLFRGQIPLGVEGGVGARLPQNPDSRVCGYPMHEIVGEVIATNSSDLVVGERVVGWASQANGLSEYIVAKSAGLVRYRTAADPAKAVMIQPLACVLSAIERLGDLRGLTVAVIGQGPIGVLFSHVVKDRGARHVIGVDRVDRTDIAAQFGVDEPIQASSDRWMAGLTDEFTRPQVVIEAVGHQMSTLDHAVRAVAFAGTVFYFGVPDDSYYPLPINVFLRRNLTLVAGAAHDKRRLLHDADSYLLEHPQLVDHYVTSTFPIAQAQDAYELATVPARGRLKVTLQMSDET
jgi:L-iditol 2-dehydrogenase